MTGSEGAGKASRLQPDAETADVYAAVTHEAIDRILIGMGNLDYQISPARVHDLAFHFLRDMLRISDHQQNKISATKFAGYWAFWIRKIKPVQFAFDRDNPNYSEDPSTAEVAQINERVALELALSFLVAQGKGAADLLHDQIRSSCARECDGAGCLERYARAFLAHSGYSMQEYAVYSMSYRTFGPHHLTMFLDQLVFGSCQAFAFQSPPETALDLV